MCIISLFTPFKKIRQVIYKAVNNMLPGTRCTNAKSSTSYKPSVSKVFLLASSANSLWGSRKEGIPQPVVFRDHMGFEPGP